MDLQQNIDYQVHLTFTLRSLQLAQPNRDLRCALRFRTLSPVLTACREFTMLK